ncbi:hypothetical protein H8D36_00130 [archaeon]|nr:hypothetical protein [archaeon]MBL7057480.1 hypothetical protein [Candidatus Woesearchaeota archaeon]
MFSEDLETMLLIDWDGVSQMVNEIMDVNHTLDRPRVKSWLESDNFDINEDLFATLYSFVNFYAQKIGTKPDIEARRGMYRAGVPRLSDIIGLKAAQCVEISALAQLYLQEAGMDSSLFTGEVLWKKKHEFGEMHTFIPLKFEGKEYIFDPANSHRTSISDESAMLLPRIQVVQNFRERVGRDRKTYVDTRSVFNSEPVWYGVGDQSNVTPDDFV